MHEKSLPGCSGVGTASYVYLNVEEGLEPTDDSDHGEATTTMRNLLLFFRLSGAMLPLYRCSVQICSSLYIEVFQAFYKLAIVH